MFTSKSFLVGKITCGIAFRIKTFEKLKKGGKEQEQFGIVDPMFAEAM
jgi:hypothetical protein